MASKGTGKRQTKKKHLRNEANALTHRETLTFKDALNQIKAL